MIPKKCHFLVAMDCKHEREKDKDACDENDTGSFDEFIAFSTFVLLGLINEIDVSGVASLTKFESHLLLEYDVFHLGRWNQRSLFCLK